MTLDAWGRPTHCEVCGEALKKHEGRGAPRKRCDKRECYLAAQKARHERARQELAAGVINGRCMGCGTSRLLPCPRECPSRAEARAG